MDIEIPVLLGFNLVNTENFSAYTATGVNIGFGGYKETVSGSATISSALAPIASLPDSFSDVTNEYNATTLGLHWLVGIKYKITEDLFVFTELKWLNAASFVKVATTSGTDPAVEIESSIRDAATRDWCGASS